MALILASTFFLFAIVGRILIQYYYSGDHGVRFAHKSAPLIEIVPGATFILAFVASIALIILNLLGHFPVSEPFLPLVLPAVLVGFLGIVITVIAQIQMGRSWRIGVDQSESTELITTGLYAKSRNPIYFGIFLYWIGISMIFPHPAMWVSALVCWISIEVIVRRIEEPYLSRVHKEKFQAYRQKTHRYLVL